MEATLAEQVRKILADAGAWKPSPLLMEQLEQLAQLPEPQLAGDNKYHHQHGGWAAPSLMSDKDIAAIVRGAVAMLMERGWTKGVLYGPDGSMCALGAIECSALAHSRLQGRYDACTVAGALALWLQNNFPNCGYFSIPTWNDSVVTGGRDEVVQWLNKFADTLDPPGHV